MITFNKFIISNPKIKLDKGEEYDFVEMADVTPGYKFVKSPQKRQFKGGGSKFQNGDVLFARITPCLEHGKIVQYRSINDKPAFGSTEFFVFRNINGISDKDFVYYLCLTDMIRKPAEKSMAGASGRQRAKIEAIWEVEINNPDIKEQQKIASILSNYDNLIENNEKRIKLLEKIAKFIYEEWFVNYKFPGYENVKMIDSKTDFGKIPEGWEVKSLGDILTELESGLRPKGGVGDLDKGVPSIGAENIDGLANYDYSKDKYVSEDFFNKMNRGIIKNKDVLLYKDGAKIGRKTMFRNNYPHIKCCINEHVFILRTKEQVLQNYIYFWLDQPVMTKNIINLNSNAAQPGINQDGVKSLPIIIPKEKIVEDFNNYIDIILDLLFNLAKKKRFLSKTRDLLLPKLISGEIDVSNLDIEINKPLEVVA